MSADFIRGLAEAGYPEHADLLALATRIPAEVVLPSDPDQRVVRLRYALRGEGPAGAIVAEVVSPGHPAEVVWPPRRSRGRLVDRSVSLPPEAWLALEATGQTAASALRQIVAEWMARGG